MPAAAINLPAPSTPILICEGITDLHVLVGKAEQNTQGLFSLFAPSIWVYQAGGANQAKLLASIFPEKSYSQVAYVCDRDFRVSYQEGISSLSDKGRKTYWSHYDIEGYFLYEDWLWHAFQVLAQSPKYAHQPAPSNTNEIAEALFAIAQSLVVAHAGRNTLYKTASEVRYTIQDRGFIPSNDRASWETYLLEETKRYQAAGQAIYHHDFLQSRRILELFENTLAQYAKWANDLASMRLHFSGKMIFEGLVQAFQTNPKGGKYSGDLLRDWTIKQADDYAQTVKGLFRDDPRLGDFGKLASKILAQPV